MSEELTLDKLKIVMAACKPIEKKLIILNDEDLKEALKKNPVLFANLYCDVKGSPYVHPGLAYVMDGNYESRVGRDFGVLNPLKRSF